MKKILLAIIGVSLLFSACTKDHLQKIEQNPYRLIVEYVPGSYTMEVPGNVTPDALYPWISVSQNGNTVSFTVTRNTQDLIRRADFSIAGQKDKFVVSQKAHGLDAKITTALVNQGATEVTVSSALSTSYPDDYAGWGIIYSKNSDVNSGKDVPQSGAPGKTTGTVSGLEEGVDYFIWTYVLSTEGDKIVSNMLAVIAPTFVRAGEDLQKAIDDAKEFQEIRIAGGASFTAPKGGLKLGGKNVNKSVTGGWNEDFTVQSMDNLTKLDGAKGYGFWCAEEDYTPMKSNATISYFEIYNCSGDHGSGIHLCGGALTVHHCYFHDNNGEKGAAIGTREEDYSSEVSIYNCKFENNIADGHGAVLGFGDGVSTSDFVKADVVSNLFINNRSNKFGGYTSIFICYNYSQLNFVNNTVVGNFNYYDGDSAYSGMVFRGNTRNLLANNIIVGNLISEDKLMPPVEQPHPNYISLGGSFAVLANNIIEGAVIENGNMTDINNEYTAVGSDYSSFLSSTYQPFGKAVGFGTLDSFETSFNDGSKSEASVKDLLEKYPTNLAGEPRVVGGKVNAGCY